VRLTVHLKDELATNLKASASNEGQSVSAFVAKALEDYLIQQRRKRLGGRVLKIAGKCRVSPDALEILEQGRNDDRS
jgi:hypothetical protein